MADNYCDKCGESIEGIRLVLCSTSGNIVASFNEEESQMIIDAAIHNLLDTVIAPAVRKTRSVYGDLDK